jgi:hypothetical protein
MFEKRPCADVGSTGFAWNADADTAESARARGMAADRVEECIVEV